MKQDQIVLGAELDELYNQRVSSLASDVSSEIDCAMFLVDQLTRRVEMSVMHLRSIQSQISLSKESLLILMRELDTLQPAVAQVGVVVYNHMTDCSRICDDLLRAFERAAESGSLNLE